MCCPPGLPCIGAMDGTFSPHVQVSSQGSSPPPLTHTYISGDISISYNVTFLNISKICNICKRKCKYVFKKVCKRALQID